MHSLKSYISYKSFFTAAALDRLSWRPHNTATVNDDKTVSSATKNTSLDKNNYEEVMESKSTTHECKCGYLD